ncbi:transposase [Sulfitobacter sp. BDSS02]|nr:transposase [Sulfitobacter sp. BDSS02]
MMQLTRPSPAGKTASLTFTLRGDAGFTLTDKYDALRAAIRFTGQKMPFYSDACVALPDQLLCVWTLPADDSNFAIRWQTIKNRFASAVLDIETETRNIWTPGANMQELTSIVDYADAVRRCWFAPVERDLAVTPEDWAYSSIHREDAEAQMAA